MNKNVLYIATFRILNDVAWEKLHVRSRLKVRRKASGYGTLSEFN